MCQQKRMDKCKLRSVSKFIISLGLGGVRKRKITNRGAGCELKVVSDSLWPHELYSPWNSPDKDTGVGYHALLQGILPTQGSNPGLRHCRQILYHLSHQEAQWSELANHTWGGRKRRMLLLFVVIRKIITTSPNSYSAKCEMLPKWELLS